MSCHLVFRHVSLSGAGQAEPEPPRRLVPLMCLSRDSWPWHSYKDMLVRLDQAHKSQPQPTKSSKAMNWLRGERESSVASQQSTHHSDKFCRAPLPTVPPSARTETLPPSTTLPPPAGGQPYPPLQLYPPPESVQLGG